MAASSSRFAVSYVPAWACTADARRIRAGSFRYNLHLLLQNCRYDVDAVLDVHCGCSRTYGSGDGDQCDEFGIRAAAAMYCILIFALLLHVLMRCLCRSSAHNHWTTKLIGRGRWYIEFLLPRRRQSVACCEMACQWQNADKQQVF